MSFSLDSLALPFVSFIFLIGLIGSLVPIIPGSIIIWAGIFIYKLWLPDAISWNFVGITAAMTVFAQVLDYLCTYWGAKRFGGSFRGGVGALLGGLFGPFLLGPFLTPLGGLIVGPIAGTILGEISDGKNLKASGKAGVGTLVGGIISFALKICISITMIGWFYLILFTDA